MLEKVKIKIKIPFLWLVCSLHAYPLLDTSNYFENTSFDCILYFSQNGLKPEIGVASKPNKQG